MHIPPSCTFSRFHPRLPTRLCDFPPPTDFLYEQYRSETLSRSVLGERGGYDNSLNTPDSVNPEELATQGVRIKEEQLRREGENSASPPRVRELARESVS